MADKKKILIADDFQLLREDLTELINNQPVSYTHLTLPTT